VHGSPTGLSKVMTTDKHLHAAMAGYVERGEIPGIVTLIGRGDEILVDAIGRKTVGGKEPMRRDTIFRIASITKPITAAAAMILVDDGKLRRVSGESDKIHSIDGIFSMLWKRPRAVGGSGACRGRRAGRSS